MPSAAPPKPVDAFLLYNGDEPLVSIIDARLTERGISTWFSPRSLRGTGSGAPSFESDSAYSETDALNSARVGVVFLGSKGWGPIHKQNTSLAIAQRKPLIRVLVGDAPADALDLLDLFRGKPPLEFRNPNDEQALDALVLAIQQGKEPEQAVSSNEPLRLKPGVDAERIMRKLVEGQIDDQQETLDELAVIWKTHDLSALAARILQTLPRYEPDTSAENSWIRAVLVAALAYTYDSSRGRERGWAFAP